MELVVDLDKVTVALARPDRLEDLVVRVAVPSSASPATAETVHRLGDVLEAAYAGRLVDASHAFVRTDALVFHAAGSVDDGWLGRLHTAYGGVDELAAPVAWPARPGPGGA